MAERRQSGDDDVITSQDLERLVRKAGPISVGAYLIAAIEFAERLSYWGCVALYTNFLQQPLPPGSKTGAAGPDEQPGALGLGQEAASAIILLTTFASSLTPLLGAYIADSYYGRFKTICIGVGMMLVAHLLLMMAALPPLLVNVKGSLAFFIPAILTMGLAAGLLKPCIGPLIAEQASPVARVLTDKDGPYLADPRLTSTRLFQYFYWIVNLGSLIGQLVMPFCERRYGFLWAFGIPTAVFICCPLILWLGRNVYYKTPPEGSILTKIWREYRTNKKIRLSDGDDGSSTPKLGKPSAADPEEVHLLGTDNETSCKDDAIRGFKACLPVFFLAGFWVCYNNTSNLISQAATMTLHGIPNDATRTINPITMCFSIPFCDYYFFPWLRKKGYRFSLLKQMFTGFLLVGMAMLYAAVVQHIIYQTSPCGTGAATCRDSNGHRLHAPISVWWQTPCWILIALGESLTMPSGMGLAFQAAPVHMRSLASAMFWLAAAGGSVISEAFNFLTRDGLLVVNYLTMAAIAFTSAFVFGICFVSLYIAYAGQINRKQRKRDAAEAEAEAECKPLDEN